MSVSTALHTWALDPIHSNVEFAVKHMMVSTVRGRFNVFEGALRRADDPNTDDTQVEAKIDVRSVDTAQSQRDDHLKSDDFFSAEKFPYMTFRSKRFEKIDDDHWKVVGDLTIRDVTQEVTLDAESDGEGLDAYGKTRAGFTATTSINRREFGLAWNQLLETGGMLVSDKVKITLHLAFVRE